MAGRPTGTAPTLSRRCLNRATLDRQLLLHRQDLPVLDAVEHLVGLQAQIPDVPYLSLWSRLQGFDPDVLGGLMRDRAVVRTPLMRTTIHLVSVADALAIRPHLQPVMARTFGGTAWGQHLRDHDVDAVLAEGRRAIAEQPHTRAALAAHLGQAFPGIEDAQAMSVAVSYLVPVVQVTPRGIWGESAQARWAPTDTWLGTPLTPAAPLEELVERFLTAFGPATVKDIQAWCGLTRLREVTDRIGHRLRRFRSEDGAELLDVPDGALPEPETPAPVRFIAEYDNGLLGYADRSRLSADVPLESGLHGPGGYVGTVLIDGFLQATWTARREAAAMRLELRPGSRLRAVDTQDVVAEGARLLTFLAPDAEHEVRVL